MSTTQPTRNFYYEDVDLGAEFTTATHTVTQENLQVFADVTRDRNPIHIDPEHCKTTEFGRPIAHGLYNLALMEGLKAELQLYETTSIASLGWDKVRFRAPVFVGDTVQVTVRFISKRLSSKPGRGIAAETVELRNQHGELVTSAEHTTLLRTRTAQPG